MLHVRVTQKWLCPYLYLVYLFATRVMTDKAMSTNSLDLFYFAGFYGDTSRNDFIFHFILLYTLLNEKTDHLTISLFIDKIPYRTNTFIGLKNHGIITVNTSKI